MFASVFSGILNIIIIVTFLEFWFNHLPDSVREKILIIYTRWHILYNGIISLQEEENA